MEELKISIECSNYKCFGNVHQGYKSIYPVNLIIGKNNSGKSALLDLIEFVVKRGSVPLPGRKGGNGEVILKKNITQDEIDLAFRSDTSSGGIGNHHEYGMRWLDQEMVIRLNDGNVRQLLSITPEINTGNPGITEQFQNSLASGFQVPFNNKSFRKLAAERNIIPEVHANPELLPNGTGASNIIQDFINSSSLRRHFIEKDLLNGLNEIFYPDSKFERILAQRLPNDTWEIHLEEQTKGIISLSNSGSGLKTVILVLINILLIPVIEGRSLESYIFAFEELENNLHPALQRRLLQYIRKISLEHSVYFFLTTHSNVVIDMFGKDDKAQILHVTNDGVSAVVKKVVTFAESDGVFRDLDFKASDLLQSNSVIWVEGPSDRTYLNKWIDLWSNSSLTEGVHYQCLFYGGKLLKHLNGTTNDVNEGVAVLKINRHAIIVMDSDKISAESEISATKKRVRDEIEEIGGIAWITNGREIENYIPSKIFRDKYNQQSLRDLGQYEDIAKYLNEVIAPDQGEKFEKNKIIYADDFITNIKQEDCIPVLDLNDRIIEICNKIKEWNNIPITQ